MVLEADDKVIGIAFCDNWRGSNDQTHPHCARAVRCVLSTEHAVRPASAAEQFGHSCSPRMWAGASTGRWHLCTELRGAGRQPRIFSHQLSSLGAVARSPGCLDLGSTLTTDLRRVALVGGSAIITRSPPSPRRAPAQEGGRRIGPSKSETSSDLPGRRPGRPARRKGRSASGSVPVPDASHPRPPRHELRLGRLAGGWGYR